MNVDESRSQIEKDLIATLDRDEITIEQALRGLDLLREWGGSGGQATREYVDKAKQKWSQASVFDA